MTEIIMEIRTFIDDDVKYINYSDYERRLQYIELQERIDRLFCMELRYNHNHDEKGRFCSGGGGGRFSSEKKLYSDGGANPEKDVDNSEKAPDEKSDTTKSKVTKESEESAENPEENKFSLTDFLNDDTITDKETEFKKHLENGDINTTIEKSQQQKHQVSKAWKNQVKQAVASNYKQKPKSLLDKNIDPQEFVDKYSGTGRFDFPNSKTVVHEFITMPEPIGKTFDAKTQKYVWSNNMQIKYTKNGIHIFPTTERSDKK